MKVTSPKSINYANMPNEREAVIYEYSIRMSELINFKWLLYGQYWSNQNYKMWSSLLSFIMVLWCHKVSIRTPTPTPTSDCISLRVCKTLS